MSAYTKTPKWIMQALMRGQFKPREARVLAYVVEMTVGYHRASLRATVTDVAAATGMHRTHVYPAIKGLLSAGALLEENGCFSVPDTAPTCTKTATDSAKKAPEPRTETATNVYQISRKREPKELQICTKTVQNAPVDACVSADWQVPKESIKERSKENSKESNHACALAREEVSEVVGPADPKSDDATESNAGPRYSKAFLVWWDAFPAGGPKRDRKQGKAKAFEVWRRHRLEALASHVMGALTEDLASSSWLDANGTYIPGPVPWLNKRRWLDDPASILRVVPLTGAPAIDPDAKYGW